MQTLYFVCFLVGLFLAVFSLLGGLGHFGGHAHAHVPHGGHPPHVANGQPAHLAQAAAGPGTDSSALRGPAAVPWWNFFSLTVFFCWFGAAGYLLTRFGGLMGGVVLVLASLCGFLGGAIVFWFLVKVLMPHDRELTADETDVVGAVGRISAAVRAGGTGELQYEQLGSRHSAPARADDGGPIALYEEVCVVRYEKGIAYVRRWEEVVGTRD